MPARFNCASSSLKPNGSIKCKTDFVAAQRRATLPVFGGISGSTRTTFIKHLPQNQSMCRRSHARDTTIGFDQHGFDFFRGKFSQTNLHNCSHNAAAHFVKKSVAFDDEREL